MAKEKTDTTISITVGELKVIIHGLKMSMLTFVEEGACDEIKAMISALPESEAIDALSAVPMAINNLQKDIGNIMRLIELYGKRDVEYKTRYKSRTGLPPRYKVLEWRGAMKQSANKKLIGYLIKTSSVVDNMGYGDISEQFLKFAKNAMNDSLSAMDLINVTADTFNKIGFTDDANKIRKIAQTYDLGTQDITDGIQQLNQVINSVYNIVKQRGEQLKNIPSAKNVATLLGNLQASIAGFYTSIQKPVKELEKALPQIQQATEAALPTSVHDKLDNKVYKIQWTDVDPQTGEQTAYVTKKDGKNYEVQREDSGQLVTSKTPMVSPALSFDPSTEIEKIQDPNAIDEILSMLGVAASISIDKQFKQAQVRQPSSLSANLKAYIQDVIKNKNAKPDEFNKLVDLVRRQKAVVPSASQEQGTKDEWISWFNDLKNNGMNAEQIKQKVKNSAVDVTTMAERNKVLTQWMTENFPSNVNPTPMVSTTPATKQQISNLKGQITALKNKAVKEKTKSYDKQIADLEGKLKTMTTQPLQSAASFNLKNYRLAQKTQKK